MHDIIRLLPLREGAFVLLIQVDTLRFGQNNEWFVGGCISSSLNTPVG